jgi:hypothetical protein
LLSLGRKLFARFRLVVALRVIKLDGEPKLRLEQTL